MAGEEGLKQLNVDSRNLGSALFHAAGGMLGRIMVFPGPAELEGVLPESTAVLQRFASQFDRSMAHRRMIDINLPSTGLYPLQIIAGKSLSGVLRASSPLQEDRNNIFACDADGVFINQWIRVMRNIRDVHNKTVVLEKITTLEEGFKFIRENFDAFAAGFDLEGLELLARLNENGIAAVTTDRRQKLFGLIPWFGTPLITKLFEDLQLGIPIITHSQRATGGNPESLQAFYDVIRQRIKSIDPEKEINITLISDILNKNVLKTPPTKKSDASGGEGKFLAEIISEIRKIVIKEFGSCPNIQPIYLAINNTFLAFTE